jgi:hypothetical protein
MHADRTIRAMQQDDAHFYATLERLSEEIQANG